MSDTHLCPCGCGGQVPRHQFACKPGWFRLPTPYRDAILGGYQRRRSDGGREHREAIRLASLWYRDQRPEAGNG